MCPVVAAPVYCQEMKLVSGSPAAYRPIQSLAECPAVALQSAVSGNPAPAELARAFTVYGDHPASTFAGSLHLCASSVVIWRENEARPLTSSGAPFRSLLLYSQN